MTFDGLVMLKGFCKRRYVKKSLDLGKKDEPAENSRYVSPSFFF